MSKVEIIKAQSCSDTFPNELLRVAAYCRVSTDSADQATSYNSQLRYYQDKIRNTPGWVLVDVYADEGITGTSVDKRKEFKRMIDDCLAGKIDMVLTKSLSRFSRNTEDTIKYVRLLRDKSIPIIFEEEHINTSSMDGELMLTVLGAVYQQEVVNTSNHLRLGF
jgi:DNA invertase Pin-like site-specific DNA recombinase